MSSSSNSIPLPVVVGLLFLAAALGTGVTTLVTGTLQSSPPVVPQSPESGDVALRELGQRVAAIEEQLAAPRAERSQSSTTMSRVPAGPDPELLRRIEDLESHVQSLLTVRSESSGETRRSRDEDDATEKQEREQLLASNHKKLLDPRNTAAQKLAAWRQLRHIPGSYDDAVVSVMTQIGLSSVDEATRADVWRQADGSSTHPAIGTALLQALRADSAASVRSEAAETLENYLDTPGVRQSLEFAAQNDASKEVRRQALKTLGR